MPNPGKVKRTDQSEGGEDAKDEGKDLGTWALSLRVLPRWNRWQVTDGVVPC